MSFIRRNTDIPVPTLYGAFEVDGSYFVIMEYIEGVDMKSLTDDQKKVVEVELHQHLATLRKLKSNTIGGPSGIVIPPYRVMRYSKHDLLPRRQSESDEFVFCHNDLSQPNIIVDPETLKINAIIDWEYAGFWPEYFEGPFWGRYGPSVAIPHLKEKDDTPKLLQFLGLEELYTWHSRKE
ncbi:hypothetical protein N7474_009684 [Penicillium riverlandense]|uniref:uncharacterized protein n=1 Tax=Penicillium riverlandense TaxID=1903569 RepID=UPI002549ACFC|nr:uncharacterized protein N7474_009684 [Penicillium riverlandense]KAJ5808415.1 hypothetical protein N7474_009684 [Penicillium riverlandense]